MAAPVTFEVQYTEQRNRLSSALRFIYAIPHLIVLRFLNYALFAVSFVHWWYVLFTGRRHRGMWNFCYGVIDWEVRAYSYLWLTYDEYPNFGFQRENEPVTYGFAFEQQANRLTCALRILWAIPALLLTVLVFIGAFFVAIVSWFAILFTGRHPRGMWKFLVSAMRLSARFEAYLYLLTDTYPKFE